MRVHSAGETPGKPAIRSIPVSGTAARAVSMASKAWRTVWRRAHRANVASSKLCTPRLSRVTPSSAKAPTSGRVVTAGCSSTVHSAPGAKAKSPLPAKRRNPASPKSAGVPPPQ